jgi:hypothetical protein
MNDETMARLGRPRESAQHASDHTSAHASAVDRLIELASDEKPAQRPADIMASDMLAIEEPKSSEENAMWKALLQIKAFLPYVSRLLPLLDLGLGHAQSSSATNELRENVTALQSTQRDLRVSVQDQTLQLKRVEENLTRMREVSEKNAFEHAELVEDVKSIGNLVRVVGAGLAILLIVLILMVGALLAHVSHY